MKRTYSDLHAEVTEWLEGTLKPGFDLALCATIVIDESHVSDGKIRIEVDGHNTISGNPDCGDFAYYGDKYEYETNLRALQHG